MRVLLATGIYPPEIGGPATYVRELAGALRQKGVDVRVLAYGEMQERDRRDGVTRVSRRGGPLLRYIRYARALRAMAVDTDIVEAFSSVSVGVPLWMAHLRGPKKILRLGGDFLWERATDRGETRGLRDWYAKPRAFVGIMNGLLKTFDTIVFSTAFQEELYRTVYRDLPAQAVIENVSPRGNPVLHTLQDPMRLLFLGRFVAFKNIVSLIAAVATVPRATLTLAGSGLLEGALKTAVRTYGVSDRVTFRAPIHGSEKEMIFREHDLLVLPSMTEISPNTALEARAAGLPVLLTEETGLSRNLQNGMILARLRTPAEIASAIEDCTSAYSAYAARSAQPLPERDWPMLADEHLALFATLL